MNATRVKLVGLKENPFTFGAPADQSVMILNGVDDHGSVIMRTKPKSKIEAEEKTISSNHFSIMKFQPFENQELFIWIKPKHKTHVFDVFMNIGQ